MPTVSVLMPVYNAQEFLADAIDSILCQSYNDWELVIINDGSNDSSKTIITQYADPRIKYFENITNIGLIETLNRGIDLCQGEFIARMDADDIAMPDRLRDQVLFLQDNRDFVMCGTNAYVVDGNGMQTGRITNLCDDAYLQINLLFSDPFVHPSMMIRKCVLLANKYDLHYKHVEDYELWCRLAKTGKIANLKDCLLKYRWHQTNVSVLYSDEQLERKNQIIANQIMKLGINPTANEIYLHKVSFQLYSLGEKKDTLPIDFDEISIWFSRLILANREYRLYDQNKFIAYVWSRWCVLCINQKEYKKIVRPSFSNYSPSVIFSLMDLLLHLKNK